MDVEELSFDPAKTSRFAPSIAALEEDGAMIEYRKRAASGADDWDPAEWIAALHKEHFATLNALRDAKAATEGSRIAQTLADLQFVLRRVKMLHTVLGVQRTRLADVLGNTPVVEALKDVDGELRGVLASLEEIVARETR